MNKTISIVFISMFFLLAICIAKEDRHYLQPVYQAQTSNAFTMYIVGGSTTATATYQVLGSSIVMITTDGLYPGTTSIIYTTYDTLEKVVNRMAAIPVTTPGAEGGIVVATIQGIYYGDTPTRLTSVSAATDCLGVNNKTTLTLVDATGMSYILPASLLNSDQQFHITEIVANATFTSGTVFLNVYSGTSTTSTQIRHQQIPTSATDKSISFSDLGTLANSQNTGMLFNIVGSSCISGAYINITGKKE